jgi:ATP-dependent helicase HepA
MDLKNNVYVRCPLLDKDYLYDPRDFIVGRIVSIDKDSEQLTVRFLDPFRYREYYEDIPDKCNYLIDEVSRCELYKGIKIKYGGKVGKVIDLESKNNDEYRYYVQIDGDTNVIICNETEIEAPFTGGKISPIVQMINYEFQNPVWYIGRTIVNSVNKILDNSILGFKELAGCKIYLMPHQLNTVMRCKQETCCRYMLADEVGMGKTIEASAVLKLFLNNNFNRKVLIVVPNTLKEQWKIELFLKFDICLEKDSRGNFIDLMSFSEFEESYNEKVYDFVIVDEVHRLLHDKNYQKYHTLSQKTDNILLLSATPLQCVSIDFLNLLRLLDPNKYDSYTKESFESLVLLQSNLSNVIMNAIDDLEYLQDEIKSNEDEENLKQNRICIELFDSIKSELENVSELIHDNVYDELIRKINVDDKDYGTSKMYIAISYICDNYKLERHIIRNRRNIFLFKDTDDMHTRPVRKLYDVIKYQTRESEYAVYQLILELMENDKKLSIDTLVSVYKPLLNAFFSSAVAFKNLLKNNKSICNKELDDAVQKWFLEEKDYANNIKEFLDEPADYKDRLLKVIDYLDQELFEDKVVVFTSFQETFDLYRSALENKFEKDVLAFFNTNMSSDELELNVYRFQNDKDCRILLCDRSGGEGRNFQVADYIIHIDLPWDVNEIEQRIGRLDRLERAPQRENVNSVVVISEDAEESLEQQLFKFWNDGLNVFNESLSGLEIVLEDINNQIFSAIASNIKYGLSSAVLGILETSNRLKKEIKKEQRLDTIGYLYSPVNKQISRLIRYYNNNDNKLFSETMLSWATLAGFCSRSNNDVVRFSANEFKLTSARNTLLIPPDWIEYIQSEQIKFVERIDELYSRYRDKRLGNSKEITKTNSGGEIKGTFDRKTAINSDYLHFFAPGDAIYDCIVENAIHSTKGQVAAFVLQANIKWEGIIYTFSVKPNERKLIAKGFSMSDVAYFRHFLTSDMAIVPVASEKYQNVPKTLVVDEYKNLIKKGYKAVHSSIEHLGQRSKGKSNISQQYGSNLNWFKNKFPKDYWKSYVEDSFRLGKEIAMRELANKSNLKEAKEEIQRLIAARISSDIFFDRKLEEGKELEAKYSIILDCLKNPIVSIESACYVFMVK